jgi:hypothetical protein
LIAVINCGSGLGLIRWRCDLLNKFINDFYLD